MKGVEITMVYKFSYFKDLNAIEISIDERLVSRLENIPIKTKHKQLEEFVKDWFVARGKEVPDGTIIEFDRTEVY